MQVRKQPATSTTTEGIMGLIKGFLLLNGVPVRPTTKHQRERNLQTKVNRQILSEAAQARYTVACPKCTKPVIVPGKLDYYKCPHCHQRSWIKAAV
jgi:tRNA(Ile2) C34 agmatinyltransferase TiaS